MTERPPEEEETSLWDPIHLPAAAAGILAMTLAYTAYGLPPPHVATPCELVATMAQRCVPPARDKSYAAIVADCEAALAAGQPWVQQSSTCAEGTDDCEAWIACTREAVQPGGQPVPSARSTDNGQ